MWLLLLLFGVLAGEVKGVGLLVGDRELMKGVGLPGGERGVAV